jgi:predicted nucleotidyltransferase
VYDAFTPVDETSFSEKGLKPMTLAWRKELRSWAKQSALEFGMREGVLGVVLGGSLARGQEWRHSDLEIGVLVEKRIEDLPYFNVRQGRGVEVIQLVRGELEEQVKQVEAGDLSSVSRWPIQLWLGKVLHDPSGVLGRFIRQFDEGLFQPEVVERKVSELRGVIDETLGEARVLLASERPAAALVRTRYAMNEAILAQHWTLGELPRSQNRTDSRLRRLCSKHSTLPFYDLYREVFALSETRQVIKNSWPLVREQVLEIARLWGDSARDFFIYAVDSNFGWRQNAGILTVYRLYVPIIGDEGARLFEKLDDPQWAKQNRDLLAFLGLTFANKAAVSALVERLTAACSGFERMH